jgi:glycosyltransferase involved in cell wall biosynthesis
MISVLIPIYNGIEFIEESVFSVLEQTFLEWELIIGINGHKKNSDIFWIAKEYEKRSPKIRVFDFYNIKGKSDTLNEMVKYCLYDYVAILDVDDIWHKDKLLKQVGLLTKYDVVGSRCIYFGNKIDIPYIPIGDITDFNFLTVNPIINSSAVLRKDLCCLNKITTGVEDYDLWLRLWRNKKKFYNCSEVLVKHRLHSASAFNNTNHEYVKELIDKYK